MAEQQIQRVMEDTVLHAVKAVEDQVDSEIDRLDHMDSDELDRLREQRLQELKKAAAQRDEWRSQGHGQYTEIAEEKEFFDVCKKSKRVVCHFYRDSTFRCKIVDKHLGLLAPKHLETRFVKISVERAPFLCQRLPIKILPTMACVIDGKTKEYIKGFDELGGHDEFSTEMLEWRLGVAGVLDYSGNLLEPPDSQRPERRHVVHQPKKTIRQSDLDSDSDED